MARWLRRLGISRRRDMDLTDAGNRTSTKIPARYPGHMLPLGARKSRAYPKMVVAGGPTGADQETTKASDQTETTVKTATKIPGAQAGCGYLHSTVDGFSRLTPTEALPYKTTAMSIGFWARDQTFFAAHGIHRITRVVTANGSNYRARSFSPSILATAARHQRIRPYTPKRDGKAERYNRTLAEELLYARPWH